MTTCRCRFVGYARAVNGCPLHDPQMRRAEAQGTPVTPTEVRGGGAGRGGAAPSPAGRKKPRSSAAGKAGPVGRTRWNPETGGQEFVSGPGVEE